MSDNNDNQSHEDEQEDDVAARFPSWFLPFLIFSAGLGYGTILMRPPEPAEISPPAAKAEAPKPCNVARKIGRFQIEKCSADGNVPLVVSEAPPGRVVVDYYRFDTNQLCTSFNHTRPLCYDGRTMNDAQKNMYDAAKQETQTALPAHKPG